jgi:NDP-hexose 2,3-enoyl reductase
MEVLTAQGKVLYAGSSNFAGWHIAVAQAAARERHFLGLVSEQCIYNLMTRYVELEVVPSAIEHGIGIIPWSPLHGGLLSGALRKQQDGTAGRSASGRSADALAAKRETIDAYEKLCAEIGHDPANVALAWLLSRPGVTAPIIGPRTMEQLDNPMDALSIELDDPTLSRLDELFPPIGDGGPGPEAWAW